MSLTYFTLSGTYLPDASLGSVSGTASIAMLVNDGDVLAVPTIPGVVVPTTIPAKIVAGIVCDESGNPGVSLLANTAALNLTGALWYSISFDLFYHPPGKPPVPVTVSPVSFEAPTSAATVDLSTVTPAAGTVAGQIATVVSANISDATTVGRQVLTAANAGAAAAAIGALQTAAVVNNSDGTLSVNAVNTLEPLSTITILTTSTAPAIGQTTYYNATSGNLTPPLPALSGLRTGSRLAVRRDPADASTNTVTLTCSGSDTFYSSGGTTATLPISGEQREYQVISVSGTKYWSPAGSLNPVSGLDARYPLKVGGALDGCTIGATTPAVSVTSSTLAYLGNRTLTGAQQPWLNRSGLVAGSLTSGGALNYIALNDEVTTGNNWVYGLQVVDSVITPAVGLRSAIYGHVLVASVGTNTQIQAQYVGTTSRAETGANLGGTALTAAASIGSFWGQWTFGALTTGATFQTSVIGTEIDVSVATGASTVSKIGLLVASGGGDAVRGATDDIALCIAKGGSVTNTFQNGISFGRLQQGTSSYINWPFASDSTLITAASPGSGSNPANIGIDFSTVTFTGPAMKCGAASISMKPMSTPTAISGAGQLYVASGGTTVHYQDSSGADRALVGTTDTQALTHKDLTDASNTFPTFNQSTTGNAATATKLAAAANINGVPFDGSSAIVVPPAGWAPSDYGSTPWKSWNYDITKAYVANLSLTAGQAYYMLLPIRQATTISNVIMYIGTAGATLTSGQCFAGLFTSGGTLLSVTADQSTAWTSSGLQTMALTTPQSVSAGYYYVGFFFNGTTSPKFQYDAAANPAVATIAPFTSSPRAATDTTHTGRTTSFPAPPTFVNIANPYFVAVS